MSYTLSSSTELERILQRATERDLEISEIDVLIQSHPEYWSQIIETANEVKEQTFGKKIDYYAPVYYDSVCIDNCPYCDYRRDNKKAVPRKRLTFDELKEEVNVLHAQGISRIELVSATDPKFPFERLLEFVRYTCALGATVLLNDRPHSVAEYRALRKAGLGWSWLWMETYDQETYRKSHPAGDEKADFYARLSSYERMASAGLNVGTGVLMGLSPNWQYDVLATIAHAKSLKRRYGIDITLGTPRYCPPRFAPLKQAPAPDTMTDDKFHLAVALYRLAIRSCNINVSTRETIDMLKLLWKGGGSMTNPIAATIPGGYAGGVKGAQFKHHSYSVPAFDQALREIGLEPSY